MLFPQHGESILPAPPNTTKYRYLIHVRWNIIIKADVR